MQGKGLYRNKGDNADDTLADETIAANSVGRASFH